MTAAAESTDGRSFRIGAGGYYDAVAPITLLMPLIYLSYRMATTGESAAESTFKAIPLAVMGVIILSVLLWAVRCILRARNARALVTDDSIVQRDWRGREEAIRLRDIRGLRLATNPAFMVRARLTAQLSTDRGTKQRYLTGWAEEDVVREFAEEIARRRGLRLVEERPPRLLRFVGTWRWEAPDDPGT
jgi:hypothetical protein